MRSADYKVKKIEILQKCDHLCAKLFVEQLTEIRLHFTDTLLGNPIISFNLENSGIVDIIEEFSRRNQKCLQNFSRNGRWTAISAIPLTPEYDAFYVGLKFSSCPNETLNLLITNDGKNVKASTWLHPVEIERELGEWNPRRYSYVIRKIVAPGKFRFRFSHFDIGKRGLIESYTPVFTSPRFSDLNGSTLVRGSDSYSDWVGVRWTGTDIVFDGFYNTSSGESFTLPELLGKPLKAGLELYTYFADDSLILLEDGNQLTSFKFSELSKNNSSKTAKWSFDASILANMNQTFNIVNMLDANLFIGIRKNKQFPAPAYAGEVLPTPQELVIFSLDNGGAVKLKLLTQLNKFSDGTFIFYNRGLSYKEGKFRFETMLLDSIWNSKRTIYKTFEIDVSTLEVRQLEVRVVEY
ncbi:MAG: hypothetical protein IPM97_07100 [Bdellovibrionaceae bacterium]|nr:hypothetical protein [Pseudobdellovibrionaceae bacterium]